MTLFSWYLTTKQERSLNRLPDKTSHVEGMWPIAKARQNTQVQHQEYVSSKYAKSDLRATKI